MTRTIVFSMAMVAMLALTSAGPANADSGNHFSNRSLNGSFGCRNLGLLFVGTEPGLPTASVGRQVFDGRGHMGGSAVGQIAGLVCHWSLTNGSYQIDPSGVGSAAFVLVPAATDDPSCESTPSGSPDSEYFVIGQEGEPFLFFDASSLSGNCSPQDD